MNRPDLVAALRKLAGDFERLTDPARDDMLFIYEWEPPKYVGGFKKGEIVGYHCRNDEIERLQKEIDSLK